MQLIMQSFRRPLLRCIRNVCIRARLESWRDEVIIIEKKKHHTTNVMKWKKLQTTDETKTHIALAQAYCADGVRPSMFLVMLCWPNTRVDSLLEMLERLSECAQWWLVRNDKNTFLRNVSTDAARRLSHRSFSVFIGQRQPAAPAAESPGTQPRVAYELRMANVNVCVEYIDKSSLHATPLQYESFDIGKIRKTCMAFGWIQVGW